MKPTSPRPAAAPSQPGGGPLDWRALVGWLREDGVISAEEAARPDPPRAAL